MQVLELKLKMELSDFEMQMPAEKLCENPGELVLKVKLLLLIRTIRS